MQGKIVFLLEEPSMKILLDRMLPRLFPGLDFQCVKHEGKSDLDTSVPRKLKNWKIPGDRFVIVRDNDNGDCVDLKARFVRICADSGRPDTLIRLVCQELESWYIGDLTALAEAFDDPKLDQPGLRKRFGNPDSWQKPSVELKRIIPTFQKGSAAREMAETLEASRNRSQSFQIFVSGVRRIAEEMGFQPVGQT